ncbi:MAG: glucosamine-6-phosphate isomerase [Ruminococcaceae bacterium]|nr:glucosamine-6-phosphate isomerase [Oscillospiraceae bacterium]
MDFLSTVKGSLLEDFYPKGWDMAKIDACCDMGVKREDFWNKDFQPIECDNINDFDTFMGHEIAMQIKLAKDEGKKLAMILPVGPMGMYKWAVYFLTNWKVKCDHVYTFNMDEWADSEGKTLPSDNPASFEYSMKQAFFNPLGEYTIPESQRNFATFENLPTYPEKIKKLKDEGAKLVLVFGIGRMCHIAFWEPQFAEDYANVEEWKSACYRIGAKLHPLTIEQNALTSFKSRTTLVPCRANTIGPGLFLQADYIIGGADGTLGRGMGWQGMSFLTTLHYGPDMNITSTFMPTLPGKLFYLKELAGPLVAECN